MNNSPAKKHFVITGASRGIGLELAQQALAAGHRVSILVRTPSKADALKKAGAEIYAGDVTSADDVKRFAAALQIPVDVLINNAGAFFSDSKGEGDRAGRDSEFSDLDPKNLMRSFEVNTIGPVRVTQALLPLLQKAAQPKVVQITSLMGSIADNSSGGYYGYRMSKAALNMFNKSLSNDFPGLIALTIHPGWVKTEMGGDQAPTLPKESAAGIHQVIAKAQAGDTGKFFDFEGDTLPW